MLTGCLRLGLTKSKNELIALAPELLLAVARVRHLEEDGAIATAIGSQSAT
jgi:hypothetical protein